MRDVRRVVQQVRRGQVGLCQTLASYTDTMMTASASWAANKRHFADRQHYDKTKTKTERETKAKTNTMMTAGWAANKIGKKERKLTARQHNNLIQSWKVIVYDETGHCGLGREGGSLLWLARQRITIDLVKYFLILIFISFHYAKKNWNEISRLNGCLFEGWVVCETTDYNWPCRHVLVKYFPQLFLVFISECLNMVRMCDEQWFGHSFE